MNVFNLNSLIKRSLILCLAFLIGINFLVNSSNAHIFQENDPSKFISIRGNKETKTFSFEFCERLSERFRCTKIGKEKNYPVEWLESHKSKYGKRSLVMAVVHSLYFSSSAMMTKEFIAVFLEFLNIAGNTVSGVGITAVSLIALGYAVKRVHEGMNKNPYTSFVLPYDMFTQLSKCLEKEHLFVHDIEDFKKNFISFLDTYDAKKFKSKNNEETLDSDYKDLNGDVIDEKDLTDLLLKNS